MRKFLPAALRPVAALARNQEDRGIDDSEIFIGQAPGKFRRVDEQFGMGVIHSENPPRVQWPSRMAIPAQLWRACTPCRAEDSIYPASI